MGQLGDSLAFLAEKGRLGKIHDCFIYKNAVECTYFVLMVRHKGVV